MLTPVGWAERAAAGFTNTRYFQCQLPIADLIGSFESIIFNWQFEIGNRQSAIGNENAPHYLSLLPEVPCCESAGSGVLYALRHTLDDHSRTNFFTLRGRTSKSFH